MQKCEPLYRIYLVVMSKPVNQLVSKKKETSDAGGDQGGEDQAETPFVSLRGALLCLFSVIVLLSILQLL